MHDRKSVGVSTVRAEPTLSFAERRSASAQFAALNGAANALSVCFRRGIDTDLGCGKEIAEVHDGKTIADTGETISA